MTVSNTLPPNAAPQARAANDEANAAAVLHEKLADAMTPGYQAEFDPEEAEQAGAFAEDALSEEDALESDIDLVEAAALATPPATTPVTTTAAKG
jgi:hypothetical protein